MDPALDPSLFFFLFCTPPMMNGRRLNKGFYFSRKGVERTQSLLAK
jgi:hypothetical protein